MEALKAAISVIIFFFLFYIALIWLTTKLSKARKDREEKRKKETLEAELKELAKWGVTSDQVYIIGGKMTMSIYAMITLANNPAYLAHLRQESVELHLRSDFFEEQLLLRIEKAKQRIQERIDRMRERGEPFDVDNKLQDLGIK